MQSLCRLLSLLLRFDTSSATASLFLVSAISAASSWFGTSSLRFWEEANFGKILTVNLVFLRAKCKCKIDRNCRNYRFGAQLFLQADSQNFRAAFVIVSEAKNF